MNNFDKELYTQFLYTNHDGEWYSIREKDTGNEIAVVHQTYAKLFEKSIEILTRYRKLLSFIYKLQQQTNKKSVIEYSYLEELINTLNK